MLRQRRDFYLRVVIVLVTTTGAYADSSLPAKTSVDPRNPGDAMPLLVDDFESYTDEEGQRVYETWIDGWGAGPDKPGNGTGAIVGYMWTPFARTPIVHSGKQAMPFSYDNSQPPYYSEAYRAWDTPQDWTIRGGTDLSLWFKGLPAPPDDPNSSKASDAANDRDDLYVALEDAAGKIAVSVHPDPAAVNFTAWTQWRIPLSEFTASGVDVQAVKKLCIGVGDRDKPRPSGLGMIHIDDIYVLPDSDWPPETFGINPGVRARYFESRRGEGRPTLTRVEESIDHDWGDGEIIAGLSDKVSARWTANLEVPLSGIYTLATDSHNEAELWLDGWFLNCDSASYRPYDYRFEMYLEAGNLYALRMEWYHNTGDARARLWWEGPLIWRQIVPAGPLQLPLRAAGPYPPHKTIEVPQSPLLTWYAGEAAAHHDIYFGDDANAVAAATLASAAYRGRQKTNQTAFSPGALEWNKAYYWRVDEVNEADPSQFWQGNVWQFTTADFLVIDDFECYSDEHGNRIYESWIEAYVGDRGSQVRPVPPGYDRERRIVHGGRQSMPLDYNNVSKPWYSEIEREFSPSQNWLVNGVDTLVLYVHGRVDNDPAPLYVAIRDTAGKQYTVAHADSEVTRAEEWIEWRIPAGQFAGVNLTRVRKLAIGAGNRGDASPGGSGRVYIDDIRMIRGGGGR